MASNPDRGRDRLQRPDKSVPTLPRPSTRPSPEEPTAPGESPTWSRGMLPPILGGIAALLIFGAGMMTYFLVPGTASVGQDGPDPAAPVQGQAGDTARPARDPVADVGPEPVKVATKPVQVGEIRRFDAEAGEVSAVAFSSDGSRMVSGGADKIIRLWDVGSGREIRRFEGHTDVVKGLDFSPDGRRILSGSNDKTVRLWDVDSGKELRRFEGHAEGVSHVRFSPEGRIGASGSWDHTARLWDLDKGRQIHALKHGDFVVGLSFSPDGKQLATGSWDRSVRLWDVETGREIQRFKGHKDRAGDVAFAPDGRHVLSGSNDKTLRLWDVKTGREVSRIETGADVGWAVAVSPDGRRALADHKADVVLWDLAASRPIHRFQGHTGQVTDLAFSPDGRTALSSSKDGSVRLWGLPSETEPTPAEPLVVARVDERPDIKDAEAPAREALAQASSEKLRLTPAKGDDAEDTPKTPGPAEAPGGDAKAPGHAPAREFETVKLDDGGKIQVEKWSETYPAYEYHPPLDILDRRVHVVLDSQRDGVLPGRVSGLAVDPKSGWLYWCDTSGRIVRARLDGRAVQVLASNRNDPHSLVLDDRRRGWLYWLEGVGDDPGRLQAATIHGKSMALSKGLNHPLGLALDSARGQLYYWEQSRLVRINVDGTEEKVLMANPHAISVNFSSLAFDAVHNRLVGSAAGGQYRWFGRNNPHLLHYVPQMEPWARIYGFALGEDHQKIYFADNGQTLRRANLDGTQVEALVTSPVECGDGWVRRISGPIALDPAHGHVYWSGIRMNGPTWNAVIWRTDLRPLPEPTKQTAPPMVAAVEPAEQSAGGLVVLSGDGLADTMDVHFIDDSTGAHMKAKFHAVGDNRLSVTVPRLGRRCRRPVIVVRTPSGVTMTLGTDIQALKIGPVPYVHVRSVDLDKKRSRWTGYSQTDFYERSATGMMGQLWLRPGTSGGAECAVVYAQHGSVLSFGSKGMVTAFAKNDSFVGTSHVFDQVEVIIYHEPFTVFPYAMYYNTTIKLIPVPAIRPSFPEQMFRYRAD